MIRLAIAVARDPQTGFAGVRVALGFEANVSSFLGIDFSGELGPHFEGALNIGG